MMILLMSTMAGGESYSDMEGLVKRMKSYLEHSRFESVKKGHGRIETRAVIATGDIAWSGADAEWKELKSFGRVTSTRTIGDKTTSEDRYYFLSLEPFSS